MRYLFRPFQHAFDFGGRATRRDLWLFVAWYWVLFLVIFIGSAGIASVVSPRLDAENDPLFAAAMILIGLLSLAVILPFLSLQVRRLHDADLSGLFALLLLLPGIGSLILAVMSLMPGTPGPNRYGDNPRRPAPNVAGIFA